MDALIVSVARSFKWTPEVLMNMYVDNYDYLGLGFWYNDVKEQNKQIKS